MTSSEGTYKGKLRSVGRRTVRTGTAKIIFDDCCWNSDHASFVLNNIVVEIRKRAHSMRMLVRLVISIPEPYQLVVIGHSSCVLPIR